MSLSAVAIQKARPRSSPYRLSDERGLYLLVQPNGGKWWRLDYRIHGRRKTISLGTFPDVGLADARRRRDEARVQVANGIDPSAVRRGRDQDDLFEIVARSWFQANRANWTPAYSETILARLERHVFPQIGQRSIADIDEAEMLRVIRKIEKSGAVDVARRSNQYCSQIFRFAKAEGRVKHNPTLDIREAFQKRPPKQRRAQIRPSEMAAFLARLSDYDDGLTKLALHFTILTMVRTTETRFARWDEFEQLHGSEPLWRIPAARMKMRSEHLVPLSRQAAALLDAIREIQRDKIFVFGAHTRSGVMSENTMLYAMYRMGFHGRATVHGFRGTASTVLNEQGFNRDWIELQLAHTERDEVRAAYNSADYLRGRREMLQWWAAWLDGREFVGRFVG